MFSLSFLKLIWYFQKSYHLNIILTITVCLQDEDEYETSSGSVRSGSGDAASCDIGLLERLIRSHPIWFLPGIQRAGAFHLLQGKDDGVSKSSVIGNCHIILLLQICRKSKIIFFLITFIQYYCIRNILLINNK